MSLLLLVGISYVLRVPPKTSCNNNSGTGVWYGVQRTEYVAVVVRSTEYMVGDKTCRGGVQRPCVNPFDGRSIVLSLPFPIQK